MAISTKAARDLLKSTGDILRDSAADLLASSDFISRTIGMNNSYEDIMLVVQALGRQPVSLLGKDYLFIFDHVRRNYQQGTTISSIMYGGGGNYWCPKFTFYKEKPTVKFADPYNDALNLLDRWMPDAKTTNPYLYGREHSYAESNDGAINNKAITNQDANPGIMSGGIGSLEGLTNCDLVRKTNENFKNGKFRTLIARFHTNHMDSRDGTDQTQTAISSGFGMSHGRNLLKLTPDEPNGYNNPYCRVWTYHHQYHRMADAIRPFEEANTAEDLESLEQSDNYDYVGFRTTNSRNYEVKGGSRRLDMHGVLNYDNGFVNIAPTAKIKDYFEGKEDDKDRKSVSLKKCMFSIENLAWRDTKKENQTEFDAYGLSAEQRGPLGGRIMWFPPYDINFSEDVSVKWNSNEFIGRGENIYTYTNTERRGNLSFTLLIDHPSVLDYWTGHERNGMNNQGVDLLPGNTNGIDGKNNQENTLLRFFAGCEILSAKPQEYLMRETKPDNSSDPAEDDVVNPNPQKSDEATPPTDHTLCCILYYPNNYSGVNDLGALKKKGNSQSDDDDSKVNPIYYLMNGIGAQKCVGDKNKAVDIPLTSMATKPGGDGTGHGGYEIGSNISITTKPLLSTVSARRNSFSELDVFKAEYITDQSGTPPLKVIYSGVEYTLAKQVAKDAKTYAQVADKDWFKKRWYYRVDKLFEPDTLSNPASYVDTQSFDLNGSGYESVRKSSYISSKFGLPNNEENFHLISFASLFSALEGSDNKVISAPHVNETDVKIVQEIMDHEKTGIKIKSIVFTGHASKAGYASSNAILADNRAKTFRAWMMGKGFPNPEEGEATIGDYIREGENKNDVDNKDANSLTAKLWRSASVFIKYEKSAVVDAAETESEVETTTDAETGEEKIVTNTNTDPNVGSTVEFPLQSKETVGGTGSVHTRYRRFIETPEGKKWLEQEQKKYPNMGEIQLIESFSKEFGYNPNPGEGEEEEPEKIDSVIKTSTVKRYDNEGEFFELLDRESPFLHHLITDKIKYFDPAFHSISPEGFNARLTFLHQCTRQGATIGNSDMNAKTAYNLAFGRPPICVLRVGDFYYTKIIINSLQLTYDNPQWDLNPEGIGVMPMFAKVSINFTFIGGSDLAGPIARLQNAVSFNYYANTSVYDNRAEVVEYAPEKTGKEIKYKPFNYPDGPGRSTTDGGILEDI